MNSNCGGGVMKWGILKTSLAHTFLALFFTFAVIILFSCGGGATEKSKSKSQNQVTLLKSTLCGNGNLDTSEGEQCDDANTADGDGCSSICKLELLELNSALALDNTHVVLIFNQPPELSSAGKIFNYSIDSLSGGLNVISAVVDNIDSKKVLLTTTSQVPGVLYSITLSNITSADGDALSPDLYFRDFTGTAILDSMPPHITSARSVLVKNTGQPDRYGVIISHSEPTFNSSAVATLCELKPPAGQPCPAASVLAAAPSVFLYPWPPKTVVPGLWPPGKYDILLEYAYSDLNPGQTYYVHISGISDLWSNPVTLDFAAFTTEEVDLTPPVMTHVNASSPGSIVVAFDEDIYPQPVSVADFSINNGIVIDSVVTLHNMALIYFDPSTTMIPGTDYALSLTGASPVTDRSGNGVIAGIGDSISFTYVTPDMVVPSLVSVSSGNNLSVQVYYDEAIDLFTASQASNYSFTHGVSITGAITCFNVGGYWCNIPTSSQPGELIKLSVSGVKDLVGHSMVPTAMTFYGDALPTMSYFETPDVNTVIVYFNEPIVTASINPADYILTGGGGSITSVQFNAGDNFITFSTTPQTPGDAYTLTPTSAAGITDQTGNSLDLATGAVNFFGSNGAPVVTAVNWKSPSTISVTFNEAVELASATNLANYAFIPSATPNACAGVCSILSATMILANEVTLEIDTAGLVAGDHVEVEVSGVKDLDSNLIATTVVPVPALVYSPVDTIAPEITGVISMSNTSLRVYFSEAMLADGSVNAANNIANYDLGALSVVSVDCSGIFYCDIITSSQSGIDYNFNIPAATRSLADSSGVVMSSGTVVSMAGTPGPDITPPQLLSVVSVNSNTHLVTFSEAMDPVLLAMPGNYTILPGLSIFSVQLTSDPAVVKLKTPDIRSKLQYTLTTSNLRDMAGTLIQPCCNTISFSGENSSGPHVTGAYSPDANTVVLYFSEEIDQATLDTAGPLFTQVDLLDLGSLTNVNISALSLNANILTITTATPLGASMPYRVSVNSVTNLTGNLLSTPASADFTGQSLPQLSVADASVVETDGGQTPLVFEVSMDIVLPEALTIDYTISDGSATLAALDYAATSGTLTFLPGETQKSVTLMINGDMLHEEDETITITITNPSMGTILNGAATGTIFNNDPLPVLFISPTSANELDASVSVVVNMIGYSQNDISVDYSMADGTATAPGDYTNVSGTITWPGGTTGSQQIDIALIDDTLYENAETFSANLSNESPAGKVAFANTSATVTIINNDVISYSVLDASVSESSGAIAVSVVLAGTSEYDTSISYQTYGGSAIEGTDYTGANGTLTWPAGTSGVQTINIALADDAIYELNENFGITLHTPTGGAIITRPAALLTITNDELPPAVSLSQDALAIAENGGYAIITVDLSHPSSSLVSVPLVFAGGAIAGVDYTASALQVDIPAMASSASMVITGLSDATAEGAENIDISLGVLSNSVAGAPSSLTLSIVESPEPLMIGYTLAPDNSYIDVHFSEAVWGDKHASLPVTDQSFNLSQVSTGGLTSIAMGTPLLNTSGGALTGGESSIRIPLVQTGSASTDDIIRVDVSGKSVYNASNLKAHNTTTGAVTLNDLTAPDAPSAPDLSSASDSGVSNTDNLTNITAPLLFTGTAEANSTVELFIDGVLDSSTTADGAGNWSISKAFTEGSYQLTAKATDSSGNISVASLPLTLDVDTTISVPTTPLLNSADDGGALGDGLTNLTTALTFEGTADPGDTIELYLAASPGAPAPTGLTVVAAPVTGDYSFDQDLSAGVYNISVTASDDAGNSATSGVFLLTIDDSSLSIISATTIDVDQNGKIDHYKVLFNKPVKDSTFPGYLQNSNVSAQLPADQWLISGYINPRLAHGTSAPEIDDPDDDTLYVIFDENVLFCNYADSTGCDTGSKPDLTTAATPGLKDHYGNSLSEVFPISVTEIDGALPVIVGAGSLGYTLARLVFSEALTAGAGANGAENLANYSISPALAISGVIFGATQNVIELTTAGQSNIAYTLDVVNVADLSTLSVSAGASGNFTGLPQPVLTSALSTSATTIEATFGELMSAATTECASALACSSLYSIAGLSVQKSTAKTTPGTNDTTFVLTTTPQSEGKSHTLTAAPGGVTSSLGVPIGSSGNTALFTGDGLPRVIIDAAACSWSNDTFDLIFDQPVKSGGGLPSAADTLSNYKIISCTGGGFCTDVGTSPVSAGYNAISYTLTLTFANLSQTDSHYTLQISGVEDTSSNAIIPETLIPFNCGVDLTPPVLTGAVMLGETTLLLTFSEPLLQAGAENINNYSIDGGGGTKIATALLQPFPSQVLITLKAPLIAGGHTLIATGIEDQAAIPNMIANDNLANVTSFAVYPIPLTPDAGPVYQNMFADNASSGLIYVFNNKLFTGPSQSQGGVYEMNYGMSTSRVITLDADASTAGIYETFLQVQSNGHFLSGVDQFYSACFGVSNHSALTGAACTGAGGDEINFVAGYITSGGGYKTIWYSLGITGNIQSYQKVDGLSSAGQSYRLMAFGAFREQLYTAISEQAGGAVKFDRVCMAVGGCADGAIFGQKKGGIKGSNILRISSGNGSQGNQELGIDSMYEHDDDGVGGNLSQFYIANGGRADLGGDGGIMRTILGNSSAALPPTSETHWEDVTPSDAKWTSFYSIALPADAKGDGNCLTTNVVGTTEDWDCLLPQNRVTPAIKAIPLMRTAPNGDLYLIRNGCAVTTYNNLTPTNKQVCPAGQEITQLWVLPKNSGNAVPAQGSWILAAENGVTGETDMGGNHLSAGAANTHITLLEFNGNFLYIGYDNALNGLNIWRTDVSLLPSGSVPAEADFTLLSVFGLNDSSGSPDPAGNTRVFSSLTLNEAGVDYLVFTTGNGTNPVRVYRTTND